MADSAAGIASRPLSPIVYSVARTWSVSSGSVEPSGMTISASVPSEKSIVARRVPSASVTALPRAIWKPSIASRSTSVTWSS